MVTQKIPEHWSSTNNNDSTVVIEKFVFQFINTGVETVLRMYMIESDMDYFRTILSKGILVKT